MKVMKIVLLALSAISAIFLLSTTINVFSAGKILAGSAWLSLSLTFILDEVRGSITGRWVKTVYVILVVLTLVLFVSAIIVGLLS
jgi:hypothetical protein